jgi:phosphate butyryltransferase
MMTNFQMVLDEAKRRGGGSIAIAGAESLAVLEAVRMGLEYGILKPVFVGDRDKIAAIAEEIAFDLADIPVHHRTEENEIAETAVALVHAGDADGLMKGKVSTPALLKAVLNRKFNLRTDRLLSHIALLEVPTYHKFLLSTDGGMVIRPTLEQKIGILKNGVAVMQKLGIARPKVAVLAAIETVNADMPETLDAEALVGLATKGELGNVEVEGPLALDIALSPESARIKGVESNISGDPDILLVPDIASGNILGKALWHLAGAKIAGLIVGARKPIILLSRADSAMTKLYSIALAVVTA